MKWYDILISDEFIEYFSNEENIFFDETGPAPLFKKFADIIDGLTYGLSVGKDEKIISALEKQPYVLLGYETYLKTAGGKSIEDAGNIMRTETAEGIAIKIMYPFWSRMGGSYEKKFTLSGELKKHLLKLKEAADNTTPPCYAPVMCDEIVYQDDGVKLKKVWECEADSVYVDAGTGLLVITNKKGVFLASSEGRRLTDSYFDYLEESHGGLFKVGKEGEGCGFINTEGVTVIPPEFDEADDFTDEKTRCRIGKDRYFVDKNGERIQIASQDDGTVYAEIKPLREGMSAILVKYRTKKEKSYYFANDDKWGFVNSDGEWVVKPQYKKVRNFQDGTVFVCKRIKDRDLWGKIDKTGKEIIPCKFEEIEEFIQAREDFKTSAELYKVYDSGKDKWGVVDAEGNWVAEPVFDALDHIYDNGMFGFYAYPENDHDNRHIGIYDAVQKKIIFEPQFEYVNFLEDGNILVEVFDEKLNRHIEKIITTDGKEVFPSVYSAIYGWKEPYEVVIRDENGYRHGLIDKKGNVLLPCKYKTSGNRGISYTKKRLVIEKENKQGLIDFDENIIIPFAEHKLELFENTPFLICHNGNCEKLMTYDGKTVFSDCDMVKVWENGVLRKKKGVYEFFRYEQNT